MSEQWPPSAPGVKQEFKQAHDATNDNISKKEVSGEQRPIVTKKELEALKSQREKPEPKLVLNPPGAEEIKAAIAKEREEKIKRMQERLQLPKGKARDDFDRSR